MPDLGPPDGLGGCPTGEMTSVEPVTCTSGDRDRYAGVHITEPAAPVRQNTHRDKPRWLQALAVVPSGQRHIQHRWRNYDEIKAKSPSSRSDNRPIGEG